jgi:ABC-type dipeptide/oligopeptide/nickel transport system permease component
LSIATWGAKPPFLFGVFPTSIGWEFWSHAILPAVTLGTAFSAVIARLTRASLLQVIREDYIRTARAKGLEERVVVIGHALKNSLIPVVTVLGPLLAAVVTGTFIVEQIFGIPGMGKHFITSIGNRDYTVITGVSLIYAIALVLANLAVDIIYAWLDPRIRFD